MWLPAVTFAQTTPLFAPFQGVGNVQFFDNNGNPLTSGVLYSFAAGTSTQQATYTDSTGTVPNPNPIPFGSGARVSIWLTSGAFYKFVLCLQNDGAFCAPADVLFSVDQVPGSGGSSSSGSTAPFISNSANPATTGILRLASGDTICWRNTANSANLCISKDTTDVLNWDGGAMKFPETTCSNSAINFDYLCADSTAHRWKVSNNGGSQVQLVQSGVDINTSDQVTQLHFGSSAAPLSGTLPGTSQYLQWNGSNIVGNDPTITKINNDSTTGTIVNRLTKLTSLGNAIVTAAGEKAGIIGITINGAGTSGSAGVIASGIMNCSFDGATTAGDYFAQSSTGSGQCHDIGTTPGGLGRVLVTSGGGTQLVYYVGSQAGQASITRDFSVSACQPANSTDSQCTGSITISPALPDASYIPQLTMNSNGGSFPDLVITVTGTLSSSSIPYSLACTFHCSSINSPTIYVHIGWHTP